VGVNTVISWTLTIVLDISLTPLHRARKGAIYVSENFTKNRNISLGCCIFQWQLLAQWHGVLEESPGAEIRWRGPKGQDTLVCHMAIWSMAFPYFFFIFLSSAHTVKAQVGTPRKEPVSAVGESVLLHFEGQA